MISKFIYRCNKYLSTNVIYKTDYHAISSTQPNENKVYYGFYQK